MGQPLLGVNALHYATEDLVAMDNVIPLATGRRRCPVVLPNDEKTILAAGFGQNFSNS